MTVANILDRLPGGPELRGLAKDSSLLGLASLATMIGMIGQMVFITHGLGLAEYGTFALVVSVVAIISRFFDVPIAYTTISFSADAVGTQPRKVAGIFQFGYLVSLATGALGLLTVAIVAPLVGPWLIGDGGTSLLLVYGLTLAVSTVDATSLSLLRVLDRFRTTLWYTLVREASRLVLVGVAITAFGTLMSIVVALVLHDAIVGIMGVVLSSGAYRRLSGESFFRPMLDKVRTLRRPMMRMLFHTNAVSYGRLLETQAPTIMLGAFWGATEVALFKVGQSAGTALAKLADPMWQAFMPRAARLWWSGNIRSLRALLSQATSISLPTMLAVALVIIVLREPVLRLLGGEDAVSASTVLVLACVAQAINGGLFWNLPFLYVTRHAGIATRITLVVIAVFVPCLYFFSRKWGAEGAAAALFMSAIALNAAFTIAALSVLGDNRDRGELGVAPPQGTRGPARESLSLLRDEGRPRGA